MAKKQEVKEVTTRANQKMSTADKRQLATFIDPHYRGEMKRIFLEAQRAENEARRKRVENDKDTAE